MEKARKIQQRLGGNGDMSNLFPDKPKGMHWRTYQKLRDEAEQAENLAWLMMGQQFGFGLR